LLAVKVLESQGIETAGICFSSNFFGAEKAQGIAKANRVKLFVEDFRKDILGLVKNPPHGLGKNMNPCIDCHATMFRRAREFAKENGFDFLASGEVLGQRPFSQNKKALQEVAKTAGEDVLRPLSAKLLSETEAEKKGWVSREKLFDIRGRQRTRQLELAKELGIKKFEAPAGGCLLTDPGFSGRLEKALAEFPDFSIDDVDLLKHGRVFWVQLKKRPVLALIGRNSEDNEQLEKMAGKKDLIFVPKEIPGPSVLMRFFESKIDFSKKQVEVEIPEEKPKEGGDLEFEKPEKLIENVLTLAGWYIPKARGGKIEFKMVD